MGTATTRMLARLSIPNPMTAREVGSLLGKGVPSAADRAELEKLAERFRSNFEPAAFAVLQEALRTGEALASPDAWPLSSPGGRPPIFLASNGTLSLGPDGTVPTSGADRGEVLFRLAEVIDTDEGNPLAATQLSPAGRTALVDWVAGSLTVSGLSEQQGRQLRSSAATVLLAVAEAAGDPATRAGALKQYEALVRSEPSRPLRESMLLRLSLSPAAKEGVGREVSARLVGALVPAAPPYEKWFAGGNRTLNLSWTVGAGGEFWGGFTDTLKWAGFTAVGSENQYGVTVYEKTVDKPGVGPTTFHLSVREGGPDFLAPMADDGVQVVGFEGHSSFGRNISASVRAGPTSPEGGDGKLVFYNMCTGKAALGAVLEKYPDAQVVTTFGTSRYVADDNHRMSWSEGVEAFLAMIDGIAERKGWPEIHHGLNASAADWNREVGNFVTPASTLVRSRVLDADHDGQANYLDKHFNFSTFKVAEDTRRELTPVRQLSPATELEGSKLRIAAEMINAFAEISSVLDKANSDSRVIAAGYYEPWVGDRELVRFSRVPGADGKLDFQLQVSADYAHMSEEALRSVTLYEFNRYLSSSGQLQLDPVDTKLNGLLLVAHSLRADDSSRDSEVWSALLGKYGFPPVPLEVVTRILETEHTFTYAGSPEMIAQLRGQLSADLLGKLADPRAGEPR